METRHEDIPLSAAARAVVRSERAGRPMHVGGAYLVASQSPLDIEQVRDAVSGRLSLLPQLRRRIVRPATSNGVAVWRTVEEIDLDHHVRRIPLSVEPDGAVGVSGLSELCGRLLASPLPEDRPPWDVLLVDGVAPGQHALIVRSHLALGDADHGLDLAASLLGLSAADAVLPPPTVGPDRRATPRPSRLRDLLPNGRNLLDQALQAVATPEDLGRLLVRGVNGLRDRVIDAPARFVERRGEMRDVRRIELARLDLAQVRAVHTELGVSVHDVVLALVVAAVGQRMTATEGPDSRWLRVLAPLVVDGGDAAGPGVASAFVSVPLDVEDPVERVTVIAEALARVRDSHRPVPASQLTGRGDVSPGSLHAAAVRLADRAPGYDLLVSNVPGPREAVQAFGGVLLAAWPLVPAVGGHELAVACTSVGDELCIALNGTMPGMPHGALGDALQGALDGLSEARTAPRSDRPAAARPRGVQAS